MGPGPVGNLLSFESTFSELQTAINGGNQRTSHQLTPHVALADLCGRWRLEPDDFRMSDQCWVADDDRRYGGSDGGRWNWMLTTSGSVPGGCFTRKWNDEAQSTAASSSGAGLQQGFHGDGSGGSGDLETDLEKIQIWASQIRNFPDSSSPPQNQFFLLFLLKLVAFSYESFR
ncbi:unnamed protein product [Cuscuta epithymum]|uniref:Uncharacterized protein n=1 Tax=Cuscuta epithymum TaxID=186058 RepID=A0AAV0G2N5_9ASTE|nr:unnamed protein product [Cuscuta epithymum]